MKRLRITKDGKYFFIVFIFYRMKFQAARLGKSCQFAVGSLRVKKGISLNFAKTVKLDGVKFLRIIGE